MVIDKSTARKEHFKIGQTVGVQAEGRCGSLRISGIVKFGSVSTIGGATLSGFDLRTAQALFGKRGRLDEIAVAAEAGGEDEQLVKEIEGVFRRLPRSRRPGAGEGGRQGDQRFISFLRRSSSPSAGSPSSSAAS